MFLPVTRSIIATMPLQLNSNNDLAMNMAETIKYINDVTQICAYGDTDLEIRFLTPQSMAEVTTLHNVLQCTNTHFITGTMAEAKRLEFADALTSRNCKRLFVGTILAGGDMAFLHDLVMNKNVTDDNLPLRDHFAGRLPSDGPLRDFVRVEALVGAKPIGKGMFFNEPEVFFRSSMPFSKVIENKELKLHRSGEKAYEVEFNHDVVQDGFERKSYVLTEFDHKPPKTVARRAVAGFACEEKCLLFSEMPEDIVSDDEQDDRKNMDIGHEK